MPSTVRAAQPVPAHVKGRRLHRIGVLIFWTAYPASFIAFAARSQLPWWAPLAGVLILTAITFLGVAVIHRGRKLMAATGDQVLADDSRAPVVYLRPFAADDVGSGAVSSWPLLKFGYFTDEEQLAMVMNEIGPFVAIGDPRESLPDLGAARIYVGDDAWQNRVDDLLSRAGLVILRAGTSEGFWWEFQVVRARVRPEQLLLLVSTDRAEYEGFRRRAEEILPHPLPDLSGAGRVLSHVRAVIAFEANWRAWELPVARSFARSAFTAPYAARLKLTLKPVYERLGVPWSAPAVATRRLTVMITLAVVAAFAGFVWLAIVLPDYFYTPPADTPLADERLGDTPARPPYDVELEKFSARLSGNADFRGAMTGITDPGAARGRGRELSMRGLHRLNDDQLIAHSTLMGRIVEEADVPTCAGVLTGNATPGLESALRQLTADEIRQWFDLVFEAMLAEVQQRPSTARVPQEQVNQTLQVLLGRLSPPDRNLLVSVLTRPQEAAVEDACKAARLMYGNLAQLATADRALLARALVTQ